MTKALPFEAAWEQAALLLPRLRNALELMWKTALNMPNLATALLLGSVIIGAGNVFYNIYLHPLRNFPGPFLARATNLWRVSKLLSGRLPHAVKDIHDKYGPVVRIAPFELAFTESQAWKDIYGYRTPYEMPKDSRFYRVMGKYYTDNILSADQEEHSMIRRLLAHGFSERSMRAQEPIFREYTDLLVQRLEEHSDGGKVSLDMREWFNYITFDVIGNLSFGSDFGSLEKSEAHPWVAAISSNVREHGVMRAICQVVSPTFVYILSRCGFFAGRKKHLVYSLETLKRRIEMETERPDFIQGLLKKSDVLSLKQLQVNASILAFAGSETTATLLSGAFYLLGTHRDVLEKVVQEVRSAFNSEGEIDLISVNRLDYMLACLKETLRQYPPVAVGIPRVVPKPGHKIAEHWVPQDVRLPPTPVVPSGFLSSVSMAPTSVSVWQLASNFSSRNFTKPDEFHPERFLSDPQFADDDLKAMQPFSVGPCNCIGMNLAYAEMRLICAKILYKFDIELAPEARDWIGRQSVYTLWDKPPLPIYLKPVPSTP